MGYNNRRSMKKIILAVMLLVSTCIIAQTTFKGVKVCQSFVDAVKEMNKVATFDGIVDYGGYTATFKTTFCGRTADVSIERKDDGVSTHSISACFLWLDKEQSNLVLKELLSAYTQKYGKYKKEIVEEGEGMLYTWNTNDAEIDISTYGGVCVSYYPKKKQLVNPNEI